MTPKEFYYGYQADKNISGIGMKLISLIHKQKPNHVFEFGCGEGKHLREFNRLGVSTFGMDISLINCILAQSNSLGYAHGDENYLRHLCNFDFVFTVSVLDHIENIDGIIQEFKRIANVGVYLLETNDVPGPFYYPHDYESLGFTRLKYQWLSDGDGAMYYVWEWEKR